MHIPGIIISYAYIYGKDLYVSKIRYLMRFLFVIWTSLVIFSGTEAPEQEVD